MTKAFSTLNPATQPAPAPGAFIPLLDRPPSLHRVPAPRKPLRLPVLWVRGLEREFFTVNITIRGIKS